MEESFLHEVLQSNLGITVTCSEQFQESIGIVDVYLPAFVASLSPRSKTEQSRALNGAT